MSSPPTPAQASALGSAPAKAGLILTVLILGATVANINTSISNVALPSIASALNATDTELTGITDAYQLGIAATVLYLGAVGDRYGRKGMLLLGALLCVPFSLASAWSPNAVFLIVAQIAVGVAGGMLYPTTLSMITALWRGKKLTGAIALWTGLGTGASVLGPIMGGYLLDNYWWGSVFLITVPFALLVLVMGAIILPRSRAAEKAPVDHAGGSLSVVMISSFVLGIVMLPQGITITVAILFAVTLVSGTLFVWRQKRAPNPLFDLELAAVPTFWVAFVAGLVAFGALVGAMFIGQQFTQNVLRYTPLHAVLLTLALAIGMLPASVFAGKLIGKRGTRFTFIIGMVFIAFGFVEMLITWHAGTAEVWVVLAYLLVGIGIGMAATPASRSLSASLPVSKAGMSSGSMDLTKDLGGAVFQALLGTLLAVVYSRYFVQAFSSLPPEEAQNLGARATQEISSSYEGAEAVAKTLPGADATQLIDAAQRAFTEGKAVAIGCALLSVLIAMGLVWWKYPKVDEEHALFAQIRAEDDKDGHAEAS